MSSLKDIIGRDKWDLSDDMSIAITFLIEKDEYITRIADYFCNGDRVQAFSDLMEKGLQAMLDMCDMDDHITENELQDLQLPARTATIPEGPANLLASFNKGLRGE